MFDFSSAQSNHRPSSGRTPVCRSRTPISIYPVTSRLCAHPKAPVRERLCYPNREERNMPRWLIVPWFGRGLPQAQEPAPPPATVFSVGTTLVQIDSVVTDSKGQQVANLKPGDFQVLVEDRKSTRLNSSYVHLDSPAVNRPGL